MYLFSLKALLNKKMNVANLYAVFVKMVFMKGCVNQSKHHDVLEIRSSSDVASDSYAGLSAGGLVTNIHRRSEKTETNGLTGIGCAYTVTAMGRTTYILCTFLLLSLSQFSFCWSQ